MSKRQSITGSFSGHASLHRLPEKRQRYLWFWSKEVYKVTHRIGDPLTYNLPDGRRIRPPNGLETDMGSVPRIFRLFISKDRFLDSYIVHDAGYEEMGFRIAEAGSDTFVFKEQSRATVDAQLRTCIESEGGGRVTRNAIHRAVRIGGRQIWNRRHKKKEQS